jgi:2-polyprenyl-3-methyl-5-hydroxy-6-metoxy-1,4-benzoquinol methylase
MNKLSKKHDYGWKNKGLVNAHSFYIPALLPMLPPPTNSKGEKLRVLDLGCGNGSLTSVIADEGFEVIGIEESDSGIVLASQNFPNCQFIQASIYDLPYTELENSFDLVIASDVIEHLLFPRELVIAARKCLKPQGKLIITTPYHGYWKNLALAVSGNMDRHFTVLWDGGHIKFFSVNTLTQLLQE